MVITIERYSTLVKLFEYRSRNVVSVNTVLRRSHVTLYNGEYCIYVRTLFLF